jgi:hypothetical protein
MPFALASLGGSIASQPDGLDVGCLPEAGAALQVRIAMGTAPPSQTADPNARHITIRPPVHLSANGVKNGRDALEMGCLH